MESAWEPVRRLRAAPPSQMSGAQLGVFSAALEQAERLWAAAGRVGATAAPMLLFYSVSQAGRAILAAHGGSSWRAVGGHGLKFSLNPPAGADALEHAVIEPHGRGLFQQVGSAVGAEPMTAQVTLSQLLHAMPLMDLGSRSDPTALVASWSTDPSGQGSRLFLEPLPEHLLRIQDQPAGPNQLPHRRHVITSDEDVREWLSTYPRLRGISNDLQIRHPQRTDVTNPNSPWGIVLAHDHDGLRSNPLTLRHASMDALITPRWEWESRGIVLPALPGQETSAGPLMTVWMILYGLSMLCRYHPEQWTNMLNVDRSPQSVPLESMLSTGLDVAPRLILSALRGETPPSL